MNEIAELFDVEAPESDRVSLLRWALMYAVVLRELSSSATLLLKDGSNSRAALMLRRVAFEYFTRFRFYMTHPEHATTAIGEFEAESERFAKRVPGQVTFIQDPDFDYERFEDAEKPYRQFKTVCDEVFGKEAAEFYAHHYAYPSFLLHGNVMVSMDVLKSDTEQQSVHLGSPRAFTNRIASNLIAFLLEFEGDVVSTFDMRCLRLRNEIAVRFKQRRQALRLHPTINPDE